MRTKQSYARVGSKWTAASPVDREKHFELTEFGKDTAILRCVLTAKLHRIPHAELKDDKHWKPGWL
jgi:tryptophan-rich hypothetical protein